MMMNPLRNPRSHTLYWIDLLNDRRCTNTLQNFWWVICQPSGHSNYVNCKHRSSKQVKDTVYEDERVKRFLESNSNNKCKIDKILDEMAHLLPSLHRTYKLKMAGIPFVKCITKIYSGIYICGDVAGPKLSLSHMNNQDQNRNTIGKNLDLSTFKESFLSISEKSRLVILPTHRSYMDFLLISYILFHCGLPLPIVAAGDNFKSMGKTLANYLKGTGAFLVRRNAQNKHDIEASDYYDILRAYTHSILSGGENPLEFFMEGTRTRTGQVLRPKTGLVSMVADMFLDGQAEDLLLLPVAINYQRPIEEQLYVKEILPQISMRKPKENFKNLLTAFDAIMAKHYGRVYVKFCTPIRMSEMFSEWSNSRLMSSDCDGIKTIDKTDPAVLYDFTNFVAARVCLIQASNTVLMPFNLIACSLLYRVFFTSLYAATKNYEDGSGTVDIEPSTNQISDQQNPIIARVKVSHILDDFSHLENLLSYTQPNFIPGWKNKLEILQEFSLDRDNIVRHSPDRNYIECNKDPVTFQTLLYYSNQTTQSLIPVVITTLKNSGDKVVSQLPYKHIRQLLSREFLIEETFCEKEERDVSEMASGVGLSETGKSILVSQFLYYLKSYAIFLNYLMNNSEPINLSTNPFLLEAQSSGQYISKDLFKNLVDLVITTGVAKKISNGELLVVENRKELSTLHAQYQVIIIAATNYMQSVEATIPQVGE